MSSNSIAGNQLVIAHRGASGYLPEHTLEAKAMAYAMGAHYIEQDVVMTRDDRLIVLHDITLDRTTDVNLRYPGRSRPDGRYYAIDFTLDEIRTLRVTEGIDSRKQGREPVYPQRFPVGRSRFRINTLAEEIELIQGLNKSTGGDVGIYPEIKSPAFHRSEGKDLSRAILLMLKSFGYTTPEHKVFVQTFDHAELKTVHEQLLPEFGIQLKLVQLIGTGAEYTWMLTAEGLAKLAVYADGIGPDKSLIYPDGVQSQELQASDLVTLAHTNGLQVHPYTFRSDVGQLPGYARDFSTLLELFFLGAGVDGIFTDYPDLAVESLARLRDHAKLR